MQTRSPTLPTMPERSISLYLGIFFTSLSAIVLQITLTRIFSVTLWYHFAYLVVSLSLFGLGAGGIGAFFLQAQIKNQVQRFLILFALLQFVATIATLFVILNISTRLEVFGSDIVLGQYTLFGVVYVVCSIPFTFAGLSLALIFRTYTAATSRLYFWDLAGSAIGALLFIAAISVMPGPAVVLVASFLAIVAAACFFRMHSAPIPLLPVLVLLGVMGGLVFIQTSTDIFRVKFAKAYNERKDLMFEQWSPLARITVYPTVFWREDPNNPFGWGMSPRFNPERPVEQLWIEQDASAGTPITRFTGDLSEVEFLKYDITALPYHIKPNSRVFIVGPGGGRDVLTALLFGNQHILACDINPVTVNLVKETYRDFAGNLYNLPQVQVEVAEARNFIRSRSDKFDILQISLIDSWAATAAGAFALSENSLYTVEAFVDYFTHLDDDGVLSITRFLSMPRTQSLRTAIVARQALENMHVEDPEQHIVVVSTHRDTGLATILAKRTPFTEAEIADILRVAQEYAFEILYAPGHPLDASFTAALTTHPLSDFTRQSVYDLRPSTDDWPFFFQMVYFTSLFQVDELVGQVHNYYAQAVLLILLAIATVLIALFYILPLWVSHKVEPLPATWGLYFILLGLGFMFVEIPLLQQGSLYLGHPTYSLSVVLFTMLLFAGLGSYWSGSIPLTSLPRTTPALLAAAGGLIILTTLGLMWFVPPTIGLPLLVKIGILVFFLSATSFCMGTAFPSGIRLLSNTHSNAIPWVWALNGGASVLGSIIAMALAMAYGYRFAVLTGASIYLLAALGLWLVVRSQQRTTLAVQPA